MRDITKLDIKYIDDNGHYANYGERQFLRLTDEEIIEIRRYHHNRLIAKNRVRTKEVTNKVEVYGEDTLKKKVRLHKDKKKKRITKRWLKRNARALIIRGMLGVTLVGGVIGGAKGIGALVGDKEDTTIQTTAVDNEPVSDKEDLDDQLISYEDLLDQEKRQRIVMIKKYCDIFQVDYNTTYSLLANLTDNFTSDDFYEGRIPGIKCKGIDVQAKSEEELIIYAIRNIKQKPEAFNLTTDELYIDNGYTSGNDYFNQIKYYSRIFGLDECLIAAIVNSETGFDSHLFNTINNPAGLRLDNDWWAFANKEEGFIELCLEIQKDYRKIECSPDEVSDDIIIAIGNIHAPLSDGNQYWVPNVISSYNKYKSNYESIFNDVENDSTKTI